MFIKDMAMLQLERQNRLLQMLQQKGFLSTGEAAKHFDVSPMTIWRDIEDLEEQGLVKRVHGGLAIPEWELGSPTGPADSDLPGGHQAFPFPAGLLDPRRIALGKYVAREIIHPGDDLILEGGSTVACLIPHLKAPNLTVITNGLNTLTLAQVYDTIQTVLCCGGVLNQPNAIFIGPQAENFFHAYRVDRALISAAGLTLKDGLVDPSPIYDSMKRVMCRSARERIAMIDSTKIGKSALSRVMGLSEIDILVTNSDADPQIVQTLTELGVDVRLVPA
jgi:DeoR/GlpR family transcriptional regulator of sugar metabolism